MATDRFDRLTRSLAAVGTRRGLLHLLPLRPLSAGIGALGLTTTAARKGKGKKTCHPCKKRTHGKCRGKKPDGTVCGPDQVCSSGRCIVPACGAGGVCRVFLSSMTYSGALGGLAGADAKCQSLAVAAGLPGTYQAWLSDSTGSPNTRFVRSTGPYRLVNGHTIAANFADLTDGILAAPISVTETLGGVGGGATTWTHTKLDGGEGGVNQHCVNWSSGDASKVGDFGSPNDVASIWTTSGAGPCNVLRRLYCFQQR
jgi:hypothetical protein